MTAESSNKSSSSEDRASESCQGWGLGVLEHAQSHMHSSVVRPSIHTITSVEASKLREPSGSISHVMFVLNRVLSLYPKRRMWRRQSSSSPREALHVLHLHWRTRFEGPRHGQTSPEYSLKSRAQRPGFHQVLAASGVQTRLISASMWIQEHGQNACQVQAIVPRETPRRLTDSGIYNGSGRPTMRCRNSRQLGPVHQE